VFGQIAALVTTAGAKATVCGAVAVVSVTGAHASGTVDVPGLPDVKTDQVIVVDDPRTEFEAAAEIKASAQAEADAEKAAAEAAAKAEAEAAAAAEEEAKAEAEAAAKAEAEAEAAAKAEQEAAEKAAAEAAAKAEAEAAAAAEAAAKAEAEAANHDKDHDDDKDGTVDVAAKIAELEDKIVCYEGEMAAAIERINKDFDGYIADIQADIDAATTPEEIAELEDYLEYKYDLRDQMIAEKREYYENKIAWLESEIAKLS